MEQYSDGNDAQPWTTSTITYDPNGYQIGSLYQYDDAQKWGQDHSFNPDHLAGFDSNAVQAVTAETERDVFHGLAATEGTPSAQSFEPEFGAPYDFTAGSVSVDYNPVTGTTGFAQQDISGGTFDIADLFSMAPANNPSGVDFYDTSWQLPVDLVDFWEFGDAFEPVILDLGTDGVEIRPRQDSTVYFDVDQDHFSEQTAWAGPNDGFLVIDLAANGAPGPDGLINQAKEISFALYTGQPGATDAEALRAFDTNANGQLDSGDTRFSEFRIWQDANQSGGVDAGELKTLTQLGITSISLTTGGLPFLLQDGSEIHGSGTYVAGGVTHTYEDAALAYDATGFTRYVTPDGNGFEYVSEDGTTPIKFLDVATQANVYWYDPNEGYNQPRSGDIGLYGGYNGFIGGGGNDNVWSTTGQNLTLSGMGGNDVLQGGAGDDVLDGGVGYDQLFGGAGDDTLYVDMYDISYDGGSGYNTGILTSTANIGIYLADHYLQSFVANAGNDAIVANPASAAFIDGRGGNDYIVGSGYDDMLVGGLGNDSIQAGAGTDLIQGGTGNDTIVAGDGQDHLDGGAGNDVLDGGTGDDLLDGGVGADALTGGDGYDTVTYASASGFVVFSLSTASTYDGAVNDGFSGIEALVGSNYNDVFYAGVGTYALYGGTGDDGYFGVTSGQQVFEAAGGGNDVVVAAASYALLAGQEIETLIVDPGTGTAAINLTGNEFANALQGNNGANVLDGGAGSDFLAGGSGNDIYYVDNAGDHVTEAVGAGADLVWASASYALQAGQEVEKLYAIGPNGNTAVNLTGNEFANILAGTAAANVLDGGTGADTLYGFAGDDIYYVDNAGDQVTEAVGGGADLVWTGVTYALQAGQEVEKLYALGPNGGNAVNLTGNEFANILAGTAAANLLDGGAGADTLYGFAGDDIYYVDNAGDHVFETAGGGADIAWASASYALQAGQEVEKLYAVSPNGTAAINLTGNEFANILAGTAAANMLDGGAGADTLYGFAGSDVFVFDNALGAGNIDRVVDFMPSTGSGADTIQLAHAIFSVVPTGTLADGAFKDLAAAAEDGDDRILYDHSTGALFYDADGAGGGAAIQFATLDNKAILTHADFFVA